MFLHRGLTGYLTEPELEALFGQLSHLVPGSRVGGAGVVDGSFDMETLSGRADMAMPWEFGIYHLGTFRGPSIVQKTPHQHAATQR